MQALSSAAPACQGVGEPTLEGSRVCSCAPAHECEPAGLSFERWRGTSALLPRWVAKRIHPVCMDGAGFFLGDAELFDDEGPGAPHVDDPGLSQLVQKRQVFVGNALGSGFVWHTPILLFQLKVGAGWCLPASSWGPPSTTLWGSPYD